MALNASLTVEEQNPAALAQVSSAALRGRYTAQQARRGLRGSRPGQPPNPASLLNVNARTPVAAKTPPIAIPGVTQQPDTVADPYLVASNAASYANDALPYAVEPHSAPEQPGHQVNHPQPDACNVIGLKCQYAIPLHAHKWPEPEYQIKPMPKDEIKERMAREFANLTGFERHIKELHPDWPLFRVHEEAIRIELLKEHWEEHGLDHHGSHEGGGSSRGYSGDEYGGGGWGDSGGWASSSATWNASQSWAGSWAGGNDGGWLATFTHEDFMKNTGSHGLLPGSQIGTPASMKAAEKIGAGQMRDKSSAATNPYGFANLHHTDVGGALSHIGHKNGVGATPHSSSPGATTPKSPNSSDGSTPHWKQPEDNTLKVSLASSTAAKSQGEDIHTYEERLHLNGKPPTTPKSSGGDGGTGKATAAAAGPKTTPVPLFLQHGMAPGMAPKGPTGQ